MPLDPDLLEQARSAHTRMIDVERDAEVAGAEFNRAVRRLQVAGASPQEIAQALNLSHQRVHQIVEATGGSRSRRESRADTAQLLSCFFCGKSQKQVKKLIAGPGVFICNECIDRVHTVLAEAGKSISTPIATIQQINEEDGEELCNFCGKRRRQVAAMAAAGETRICNECLSLCDEIVIDEGI